MNKKSKVSISPPGGEIFEDSGIESDLVKSTVTREMVHEFLKKDLQCAINCLDAIYRDQDLLQTMVDFMYGRFTNARHKQELSKQAQD